MDDMSVQEMEKLLDRIEKKRFDELNKLKNMWPNPTAKQAKKIAKAKWSYEKIRREHIQFKNLTRFA